MEGTAGAEAATNEQQKSAELVKVRRAMEGQEAVALRSDRVVDKLATSTWRWEGQR